MIDNIEEVLKKRGGRVEWIHLAQDKDKWRGVVSVVINLKFP